MDTENLQNWQYFLSNLKKSKSSSTPKKPKQKDVFLGNIDCFSTNLSRQLLGTSGQIIETELTPLSLMKLKTSAVGSDVKHDYVHTVPVKRSEEAPGDAATPPKVPKIAITLSSNTQLYKHALNTTGNQTLSEVLEVDKPDSDILDEFEEGTQKARSHMDDVSDLVKVELDSSSSEVPKGQVYTHASNTTGNQTFSKGLGVDKTDTDFSDEFEEGTQKARSHMDDVSDLVKVESDSSSEVLRKQSTKVIEPDMFENISNSVKVEANSISPEVLRKQTTKLLEPGTLEALGVEAQVEEMCEGEVSEKKSKVAQELKFSGLFSAVQRPGEKAASSSHPDKTYKLEANGKKRDFVKCLYQKACPKKAKVPTILAAAEISEIKENIETNRVRQRYTNKNKRKADVDTPCSQWTLEMLSQYVDFKQSVGEIEEKKELEGFQNIIDRTVRQTLSQIETVQQVIFAPHKSSIGHRQPETGSGDIYNLSDIRGTEADVRILLDTILIPFAKEMQLNIETEKSYKNKNLPNCTFDYRIHYKNEVVGLVEAKSRLYGSGICPDSVVQGIIQLSALQAEVYGRMTRANPTSQQVDPLSLFNIISDGYQFIFIQLDQKKLLFDHQPGEPNKNPTIRCYVMDSRKGIEEVLVKLAKHLLEAINRVDQEKEDENVEMEEEEEVDE